MANRFTDALAIQQGACNPSGIAHSIVEACAQFHDDKNPYKGAITEDAAIRLMVHQLAHICRANDDQISGSEYCALVDQCRERAS